jgi:ABC-2 type transport system permease protein
MQQPHPAILPHPHKADLMTTSPSASLMLGPRHYGTLNWIGLRTLYAKEVRRFIAVGTQTVLAPMVTTLLFLAIFVLALGHRVDQIGGQPYMQFLVPGLIMMAMTQNAFANTSSSLLIAKVQGNIVDLLMPPLSPLEQTIGIAGGGLTRGLVVGASTALGMWLFTSLEIAHPLLALFYAVMASLLLALIGMLAGIWAVKFDHMAAVTNFVITPLSFLSGTFYSTERLAPVWKTIAHLNPFFYMIDGFRYAFIDHADGSVAIGMLLLAASNLALLLLVHHCFASGYKLKA